MTVRIALDTVTDVGSVALEIDDAVVAQREIAERTHAAMLLPSILSLLDESSLALGDIDEILVADGPGSFTGIRIGFATVAGLAAAGSIRVFVASSMKASSRVSGGEAGASVVVLYDALRGDVYAGVFRGDNGAILTDVEPHITRVEDLRQHAPAVEHVIVSGTSSHVDEDVEAWMGSLPRRIQPVASNLLALRHVDHGVTEIGDLSSYTPNYGRLAEAQVRWERVHGRRLPDSSG